MKFSQATSDFIRFTSTKPGEVWHIRHIWSAAKGWQVEWRCADRNLILGAVTARQLARYLIVEFGKTFRKTPLAKRQPAKEDEILKWVSDMDAKGKVALHNNRNRVVPPVSEQVPA